MRNCIFCGLLADFYCLDCHAFSCFEDLCISRKAWDYNCGGRPEGHAFVPIIQQERGYRIMKASNPEMALREGRKFAALITALFQKVLDVRFEDASDFAQYFAIDVLGYRDAEIANAWTRGFISVLMKTPTSDELSDQYAAGSISLEQFQQFIRKAIQQPNHPQE